MKVSETVRITVKGSSTTLTPEQLKELLNTLKKLNK